MMKNQRSLTGRWIFGMAIACGVFLTSEAGTISTKYGLYSTTGAFAGDGGQSTDASFNTPYGTWVSTDGVAYIADENNKRIRKVDASGIVSSLYGSSSSAVIGTSQPFCVIGDTAGNIYFSGSSNSVYYNIVSKIDTSLSVSVFAGGGTLGTPLLLFNPYVPSTTDNGESATNARIIGTMLSFDTNGDLYATGGTYGTIKKVSVSSGILTYAAGTGYALFNDDTATNGDGGPATSAKLQSPSGIYIDTLGMMYISAWGPNAGGYVRKVDLTTGIISRFAGAGKISQATNDIGPATSVLFNDAYGSYVAGDSTGSIYYVSTHMNKVYDIDTSAMVSVFAGTGVAGYSGDGGEATQATLNGPYHIFIRDNDMYITDSSNNVVRSASLIPTPPAIPTVDPTEAPTIAPTTIRPSVNPTLSPSMIPSALPSVVPTLAPSLIPSLAPTTAVPTLTFSPSVSPTATPRPSLKPTNRPSARPSRAGVTLTPTARPTVSPTAPIVVISFNSSLYLHNVTASSLDVTSQSAVTSAVAATLNISNNQVSYVSQQLITGGAGTRRQLSVANGYEIMMTMTIAASTADFTDAVNQNGSYLFHRLTNTLVDAVESNEFTRTVREKSAALGAVSTLYVGYVNLTVSADFTDVTPLTVNDDESDDGKSGLSGGAIAGIVIGAVVALVLVLVCLYFVCRGSKKSKVVVGSSEMSPA